MDIKLQVNMFIKIFFSSISHIENELDTSFKRHANEMYEVFVDWIDNSFENEFRSIEIKLRIKREPIEGLSLVFYGNAHEVYIDCSTDIDRFILGKVWMDHTIWLLNPKVETIPFQGFNGLDEVKSLVFNILKRTLNANAGFDMFNDLRIRFKLMHN